MEEIFITNMVGSETTGYDTKQGLYLENGNKHGCKDNMTHLPAQNVRACLLL